MTQSLSGRHFLKLLDFSSEEIVSLVDLAQDLKEKKHAGVLHKELEGKNIVLLFLITHLRTRRVKICHSHAQIMTCNLKRATGSRGGFLE